MFAIVAVSSDSSLIVSQECDGAGEVEQFLSVSVLSLLLHLKIKNIVRFLQWLALQSETF